jgi:hypothetical protein
MGSLDVSAYYERVRKNTGITLEQKLTVSSMTLALDCVKVSPYVFVGMYLDDSSIPEGIFRIPLLFNGKQMTLM